MRKYILAALLMAGIIAGSCNAFMHGYTENKAQNAYYLVTGDKDNFGDRRLKNNKGFYKRSELAGFLGSDNYRGAPQFIYEYETGDKLKGIRLFYPALDSVFIFEQPKKNCACSALKQARKMDGYERLTFQRLKEGKE